MNSSTSNSTDMEQERLASLKSYSIEYGLSEKQFDEITKLASIICNVSISLITFIDEKNQWVKSRVGTEIESTERRIAFCNKTILTDSILEIPDLSLDDTFKNNPLVANYPNIGFYAGAPIITPDGYRIGALCVIDQKPGELTDKQREALTVLSHSVVSLLELKKQQQQLMHEMKKAEEAVKAKADFLSTMSHEIRTPLNGITGIVHLLLEEDPQPHQIDYLKTLKFSTNNLMSIVNDILDFSKIEARCISFENIPYNLTELLSEIKNANQLKAQDKQIRLKLKHDDDAPEIVMGDPVRLSQVLNNLVSNAIKFTHKGEVVIDLQLEELTAHQASISFSIKDTGIGIPHDKQELLFQQFSQVDSSITRKFGGTGLGLAISKRLLELQGSAIKLVSEENKGSEFSFVMNFALPLKESEKISVKKAIHHKVFESLNGASILLVEDNEVNALIAKRIMKNWDVQITHALNGAQAIALAQSQYFDIVLMDLQMPIMDGYEATRSIRAAGYSRRDLPIIALTASAMANEKDQAFEVGMNDFISKPFNPTELYSKIEKYLFKKCLL